MPQRSPPPPYVHSPPNVLRHIGSLWAYLSIDGDGNEGLCAGTINGVMMPLIAADQARLKQMTPVSPGSSPTRPAGKSCWSSSPRGWITARSANRAKQTESTMPYPVGAHTHHI